MARTGARQGRRGGQRWRTCPNGTNGVDGAAGPKGDPCLSGDPACVGPKGDRGDPGTNGTNGVDGAAGPKGDPCLSSDRLCIGPKGDQGDKGDPGTNGTNGATGLQGPIGPTGAAGSGVTTGRIELQAQTLSTAMPVATPTTLLTIPGVGDFTAVCTANGVAEGTRPGIGIGFDNTTSATEDLWTTTTLHTLVPAGTVYTPGQAFGTTFSTWHVGTGFGPTAHVVTFIFSGFVIGFVGNTGAVQQPCLLQWTALIQ